jgi:hypothetical protein
MCGCLHRPQWRGLLNQLTLPGLSANDAAEVDSFELWVLIRENIGLDVAKGGFGLVLDAILEGRWRTAIL